MIINLPKLGPVRFDDNLTEAQLNAQLNALSKKYDFKIPVPEFGLGETFTRATKRGAQQLGILGGDVIPAMIGKGLGFEDYAARQMEEAAASQQEIARQRPPIFESYKQVESPYQALQFGIEVIGEQIPNIATALIPGVGGGVLAGRAALSTVGKSLATQAAERGLAGEAATAFIAEGMKRAAPQIAAKAQTGQNVGIFLGSYAQNAPEIFQNIVQETGQMEVGTSLLFGAGAAALDSILPAQLARQLTGPMKAGIVEKVLEKSGMDRGILRSTTSGLIKGTAGEGLTEGAQEALSIAAEKFVADNPQVFGSKEWDRIMEASVRGAVAGGGFGVAGGTVERMREASQRKAELADALERRGQRQEAARLRKEVEEANVQIAAIESGKTQMELPGLETGAYTTRYEPKEVTKKAAEGAKNKLGGKQLEMFGPEGELTKQAEKAATADEKRAVNVARQQAKKEAAELKAYQDSLKKFLGAKQLTLPGMSPEEIATAKQQQAALEEQIKTTGQGDLFSGMPPAPETPTTEAVTAQLQQSASQWDKQNRTGRSQEWMAGAAEANPVFESVAQEGANVPAHGMAKAATLGQAVKDLVSLLTGGIDSTRTLYSAPLTSPVAGTGAATGTAGGVAYRDGPFIITFREGLTGQPTTADITGVLVNPANAEVAPLLQQMFPDLAVRTYDQAADVVAASKTEPQEKPSAVETEVVAEPTKVAAPSGITGTIISADKPGLAALGKQLGIGRTAKILREDGPLAGKDLSDPAQAAEVKQVLEAYASGKPAEGAAAKIEEFLLRPEFQVAPVEVPSEPTAQFDAGRNELSIPSDITDGTERVGDRGAGELTEPISGGLDETGLAAGDVDVREEDTGRPLGVKETKDVARAEAATEEAVRQQADFVTRNDERTNNILTGLLREAAAAEGIDPKFLPAEDLRGTPEHSYLRLPSLINEYLRLRDLLGIPPTTPAERAQAARNQQEFEVIRDAILQSDPNMPQFLQNMEASTPAQREQVLSQINREAISQFAPVIEKRIASLRLEEEERAAAKPKAKLTEADLDQLADEFNERLFEKTGKKLFLPVHRGLDLSDAGRTLVESGDLKGVIDYLRNSVKSKVVQQILNKIKTLNLGTKIVVGPVEGNQAGSFDPRTNTITISPEMGMNEHTLLHELMHAAISHVLRNPNLPVTKQLTSLFTQIQNQMGAAYGAQDLQEFAAELVSNPEFQALLKTIKTPKSQNMFVRFMQTLAEFFGFAKGTNAYDKGLKLVSDAIDISADVDPSPADVLFLGTPNGAAMGLGVVGRVGQTMPALAGRTVEETKNYLSNMPGDAQSIAMGLLRLDNINTIYGKELPSLQKLLDALERRNGMQEKYIRRINENYKRFLEVESRHPQAMQRMNDMAIDARLEQVDLLDPKFKPSAAQLAQYNRLKNVYNGLPDDVKKVYRDIRGEYDAAINEYEDILLNSVQDPSIRRKLKAQYEAKKRQIGYIPFLRRGDFWVEYDENGERAAQAFQSQRERQIFIDSQLKGKSYKVYQNINEATFNQSTLPSSSFIVGLMGELNKQGASDQLKQNVYQSYLALFPAESLAKNFMKSENVRGMERDIVRGYGETMIKWARKLSSSKYNPEIDRALSEIATQGREASTKPNGAGAYAAAQNVMDQASFLHNPTYGKLVSAATTLSYFNYIAGNVSSALVNLTTLPMFSWSILGAKFGFDKSSTALLSASKTTIDYIFNNKVPSKYAKLFDVLNDHAQLEHTMAREVLEGRRQTTSEFTGTKARIMDILSIPFSKTEVLNRGATAIAAYDLARGSGMKEDDAIRYALNTVKEINTSGLSATAPRYMQHPAGRIFFTFKSFVWNTAFVVGRAFHQAVKGESPAVRKEAFRQLIGIYGMAMAFAGIKGLPFMGAISTLATVINSLLGDDDEPYDFDVMMRSWTNELFYKGLINYATNLEVANRVGVANDLLFRDDPKGVAENGYVLTAMKQAFGPAGSFAASVGDGATQVSEGNVARGIEAMLPTFLKNGFKAWRYASEGVTNRKGELVIDDISSYNIAMQVIGFSPANLSNVYEEIGMKKDFERKVMAQRSKLLNKYDMARRAGDSDLLMETLEEIGEYNEKRKDPKAKITQDTLSRSVRAREAAERDSVNGVRFNKNLRTEIDDLLEEYEE